jgi:hypothetical protein
MLGLNNTKFNWIGLKLSGFLLKTLSQPLFQTSYFTGVALRTTRRAPKLSKIDSQKKWSGVNWFAMTILSSCLAYGYSPASIDLRGLDEGLNQIKRIKSLPSLLEVPSMTVIEIMDPVPIELVDLFNKIQIEAFGSTDLLTLSYCKGCGATSQINGMVVFIDPLYVNHFKNTYPDSKSVLAFVFAHEISHFIHEYFIQISKNKKSPSGFSSIHYHADEKVIESLEKLKTEKEKEAFLKRFHERDSRAHAEMDIIALKILKRMGWNLAEIAAHVLTTESHRNSNDFRLQMDSLIRVSTIQKFKNSL